MKSSRQPGSCSGDPAEPQIPLAGVSAVGPLRYIGCFDGWNIWEDVGDADFETMRFLYQHDGEPNYRSGNWTRPQPFPQHIAHLLTLL